MLDGSVINDKKHSKPNPDNDPNSSSIKFTLIKWRCSCWIEENLGREINKGNSNMSY